MEDPVASEICQLFDVVCVGAGFLLIIWAFLIIRRVLKRVLSCLFAVLHAFSIIPCAVLYILLTEFMSQ